MEKVYKDCMKSAGEMVVPLIHVGEKCAMGEDEVINMFKSLIPDIVDAALDCCKE
jgi:hypothetical protein